LSRKAAMKERNAEAESALQPEAEAG
jgi:hypothetical protein